MKKQKRYKGVVVNLDLLLALATLLIFSLNTSETFFLQIYRKNRRHGILWKNRKHFKVGMCSPLLIIWNYIYTKAIEKAWWKLLDDMRQITKKNSLKRKFLKSKKNKIYFSISCFKVFTKVFITFVYEGN